MTTLRQALFIGMVTALACDQPTAPAYVLLAARGFTIVPTSAALAGAGATALFEIRDSSGASVPADSVTWFSLNPAVAAMDGATGRTTAVAAGQAVVGARIDTVEVGYAVVNVAVPGGPILGWSADTLERPDLHAVWGTADDNVFVGGRDRYVHRFDGADWRAYPLEASLSEVYDLGGATDGPILAVGYQGIQRFDGQSWRAMLSELDPRDEGSEFPAVWAATAADAFAVDGNGRVWRYDGSEWKRTAGAVGPDPTAIGGSAVNDVYVGDDAGTLIHFDGVGWSAVDYGESGRLRSIWASGPEDVYVSGLFGMVHYDGTDWAPTETGLRWSVERVAGSSPGDVWAFRQPANVPGQFARFDGSAWTRHDSPFSVRVRDLWVSPSGAVYAAGDSGSVTVYADGVWTRHVVGAGPRPITGIWAAGPGDLVTAGSGGALRGDAADWRPACPAENGRPVDAWGVSPDLVFISGYRLYITHVNPGWCEAFPVSEGYFAMTGVWASAPNDAWVVGAPAFYWIPAVLFHWDGERWRQTTGNLPGSPRLYDVWGAARDRVWAVGESEADGPGAVFRFDGTGWFGQTVPAGPALKGVWGVSREDVYAVGLGGRILHYDGTAWTAVASPVTADLYAVSGTAPTDLYAVGDTTVLHFDGSGWSVVEEAPRAYYRAVRVTEDAVYFGAEGQIIMAYR